MKEQFAHKILSAISDDDWRIINGFKGSRAIESCAGMILDSIHDQWVNRNAKNLRIRIK